ncbi:MAG TPA: pseudouridine-5'-phosphate glycosidase [Pyrinomonadaceae bacterium]|jgi:pseudouridine-5'-phosphate glycosidase|nr:pseudouridine-5'-phosphate glycosidase [Pyrinomonadaceae bacterium]
MKVKTSDEIAGAIHFDKPIVALESTVIAHGLPYPKNVETAVKMEEAVRKHGAVPATIAIFDGEICVGITHDQIERLATEKDVRKISRRDMSVAIAKQLTGATTVATTSFIAHAVGIKVFATGGIGGVHRGHASDVSADLPELARTPMIVVCSGAKSVLDLEATREWLETHGVTVLGWKCDEVPAFYSRTSGMPVDERVESAREVADIASASRNDLDMRSAVVLAVPVPQEFEIGTDEIEDLMSEALSSAIEQKITGKAVTPFLLSQLSQRSGGRTLAANIALLENNALVAAEVARALNY